MRLPPQMDRFVFVMGLLTGQDQMYLAQSLKPNASACRNDSGGGYFVIEANTYWLYGLQSLRTTTFPCGDANSLNFAVNVVRNREWIRSVLNRNGHSLN